MGKGINKQALLAAGPLPVQMQAEEPSPQEQQQPLEQVPAQAQLQVQGEADLDADVPGLQTVAVTETDIRTMKEWLDQTDEVLCCHVGQYLQGTRLEGADVCLALHALALCRAPRSSG